MRILIANNNRSTRGDMTATEDVHEGLVAELVHQAISRGLDQLTNERDGKWPIRAEFTVEKGQQAIEKTVQGWDLSESWKHCIDYLGTRSVAAGQDDRPLHVYRVQWSEPTRRKPVPVATASVYFFLQQQQSPVQDLSPLQSPVQAYYVLEGQRLVHKPDRTKFQEIWLRDIIQHKLSILTSNPQWSTPHDT